MKQQRGFTLIEMLVAMAIVAVIGVMALGGLNLVLKQRDVAKAHADRWRQIQFAMQLIEQDLAQITPRPTRDPRGESWLPAVLSNPNAPYALAFSRGGWSNPAGFKRGTVLRVAFRLDGDTLQRLYWPVMDRTLTTQPLETNLLTGVSDLHIAFMDSGRQWHAQWPPLGSNARAALVLRPRAIRIRFKLKGYGTLERIVETSS